MFSVRITAHQGAAVLRRYTAFRTRSGTEGGIKAAQPNGTVKTRLSESSITATASTAGIADAMSGKRSTTPAGASMTAKASTATAESPSTDAGDEGPPSAAEKWKESPSSSLPDPSQFMGEVADSVAGVAAGVAGGLATGLSHAADNLAKSVRTTARASESTTASRSRPSRSSAAPPGARAGFENWTGGQKAEQSISSGKPPSHGVDTGEPLTGLARKEAGTQPDTTNATERTKWQLLGLLSLLDRGAAASTEDTKRVEHMVSQLVDLSGSGVNLVASQGESAHRKSFSLDGTWQLVYSIAVFSSPVSFIPGRVEREISNGDVTETFLVHAPLSLSAFMGGRPPGVTVRAQRAMQIEGPARLRLLAPSKSYVQGSGGFGDWFGQLPALETPSWPSAGEAVLDVLYLDGDLWVVKDLDGNLSIYIRA